jgi:hypothetical protein
MTISVILDDKLATSGIEYNYDYLLKGNYQSKEKTEDSWKVVDVRDVCVTMILIL